MKKYLTVFQLSFQNEFTYRLNFVLWRVRNVLRILMIFFLWNSIFSQNIVAFGFRREQMMAYVFLVLLINSLVMSAPSNDNIGSEISNGDLSNFLVKPIHYLHYWLTRDLASKLLNALFAIVEVSVLYFVFRPQLSITGSPVLLLYFLLALGIAVVLYFFVTKLAVLISFWIPENTWGMMFTFFVLYEVLSGALFPLSILPPWVFILLQYTPFPYLIYFPVGILVGSFDPQTALKLIAQGGVWIIVSYYLMALVWKNGLKVYAASGR